MKEIQYIRELENLSMGDNGIALVKNLLTGMGKSFPNINDDILDSIETSNQSDIDLGSGIKLFIHNTGSARVYPVSPGKSILSTHYFWEYTLPDELRIESEIDGTYIWIWTSDTKRAFVSFFLSFVFETVFTWAGVAINMKEIKRTK